MTETSARPSAVGGAIALLLWSAAIAVLGLLAVSSLDPPESAIVLAVLGILAQIGLAWLLSQRHNWARLVTLVFVAVSLGFAIVGFADLGRLFSSGGVGVFLGLAAITQAVIGLVILVLLRRSTAVAWFTR